MKLSALALTVALLCDGKGAAGEPAVFISPTVGLELTKPAGWVFLTAEQNRANLQATQLVDSELKSAVTKYATTPLVVVAKHAEPYPDLNPSVKVNFRALGDMAGKDPKEIAGSVLPAIQRMAADVRVTQAPMDTEVSGMRGAYVRLEYTLTAGGATFQTTSELWIVPRGEYAFIIGAGTRQDEATGTRAEIQQIVKSIKLSH